MKLRGIDSYPFVQCEVCGADIAKKRQEGAKNYLKRKVCRIADKPECAAKYMHMTAIKNISPKNPITGKSEPAPLPKTQKPAERKIQPEKAAILEAEQQQIRQALDQRYLPGRTTMPARSLSEQERRELEKVYTPPTKRDNTMPHYQRRSWGDI